MAERRLTYIAKMKKTIKELKQAIKYQVIGVKEYGIVMRRIKRKHEGIILIDQEIQKMKEQYNSLNKILKKLNQKLEEQEGREESRSNIKDENKHFHQLFKPKNKNK